MRILAASVAVALALPSSALAESASRPPSSHPVTIAVFGDSLAEGLWASLYRRFARERDIRIVNATRASTGFHSDAYDESLDRLLAHGRIDLLVVQTGANDRQPALSPDGRGKAAFATPLWHAIYGQRLTYFFARAQRSGVPVLWVGLPVMRDAPYDRGMRLISQMHRDYAERHGAAFLEMVRVTADAEGAFVEKLPVGAGRVRRFRHQDGVHFWEFGYDRVADYVLATVRTRFPRLLPEGRARAELPSHKP